MKILIIRFKQYTSDNKLKGVKMKLLKGSLILLLTIIALQGKNALADGGDRSAKTSELNYQLANEIKEVLKTPLLVYSDRDLNGNIEVTVKVEETGKINFLKIDSENISLEKNALTKLNSLNLWTGPDLSGIEFKYEVKFRQ